MASVDGLLVIDKPEGVTSHDVVVRVRRALRMKRIGHTGTLDPIATGVLIVCLGRATRLQRFMTKCDKEYMARIRLGFATDTHDRTGKPLSSVRASKRVMKEHIQEVLNDLRGAQRQLPPMFSAKKRAGTRLYKLARQGQDVPRKPVPIRLDALEFLTGEEGHLRRNADGTSDFSILVRCSAGTYVRSLAHEIGERLGCGAHLLVLRRTAVGDVRIERAVPLDEFERLAQSGQAQGPIIPLAEIPLGMPIVSLSPGEVDRIRRGQAVRRPRLADTSYCKLIDERGTFIAVGQMLSPGDAIQPRVVLC